MYINGTVYITETLKESADTIEKLSHSHSSDLEFSKNDRQHKNKKSRKSVYFNSSNKKDKLKKLIERKSERSYISRKNTTSFSE